MFAPEWWICALVAMPACGALATRIRRSAADLWCGVPKSDRQTSLSVMVTVPPPGRQREPPGRPHRTAARSAQDRAVDASGMLTDTCRGVFKQLDRRMLVAGSLTTRVIPPRQPTSRNQASTRPDMAAIGHPPSHTYPTNSGTQPLPVASGCMPPTCNRDAIASLSCSFAWWQVLGSNQRRLSRRFYRPLHQTHRNGR